LSYRIYLADDHILVREGIKMILSRRPDFVVAGEAGDGLELLSMLKHPPAPDAVLMDLSMPKLRGLEAIREIKNINSEIKILVLTMHREEEYLCQAFLAGAEGYILKEDVAKELFDALDAVLAGKPFVSRLLEKEMKDAWLKIFHERKGIPTGDALSPREREILKLVAEGQSNKEIADQLCISARTVDHHRAKIMEKLNFKGTVELIKYALKKGYIS
jgi:two-component system, NarL family, response regulator NreC